MLCPNIALLDTLQKNQRPEAEEMAAANLPLLASRPCSSNCKDRKGSSTFKKALLVIPVCGYTACMLCCSVVSDSATPWTVARQAPLSMAFSRQEYWSGLPCPPPGDLLNPWDRSRVSCTCLALPMESLLLSHRGSPKVG